MCVAGPDVALQRHDTIEKALTGQDETVNGKLAWVRNFTAAIGSTLDVVPGDSLLRCSVSHPECRGVHICRYRGTHTTFTQIWTSTWHITHHSRCPTRMHAVHMAGSQLCAGRIKVNAETHRLWDTRYLDMALWLSDNMTQIAHHTAPQAAVWLSESNSVCHQGVSGATNAYVNSVWLVNRLGRLAAK